MLCDKTNKTKLTFIGECYKMARGNTDLSYLSIDVILLYSLRFYLYINIGKYIQFLI